MMESLLRSVPLWAFSPLRHAVTWLPRGHPLRSASIMLLRPAMRAYRRRLGERLAEVRPIDAPELRFKVTDSTVIEAIFWGGVQGYEGIVLDVWRRICARSQSVLEVGGNVGLFTVVGARAMSGRYTVVEPVPAVAEALRENLRCNGLDLRVELLTGAAVPGLEEREVVLNIPAEARDMPVGAHLAEDVEVAERNVAHELAVPGFPMRRLIAGRDAVKIDAEGIEHALLVDCAAEIAVARPALLLEVLPEANRLAELIRRLARDHGYTISILPEYGRHAITEVDAQDFHADLPARYNSKSVALTIGSIPRE